MGIFVNYYSYLERSEEDVLEWLGRFRERESQLDAERVGEIMRVEPIYNSILHHLLQRDGYKAPPEVEERIPPHATPNCTVS